MRLASERIAMQGDVKYGVRLRSRAGETHPASTVRDLDAPEPIFFKPPDNLGDVTAIKAKTRRVLLGCEELMVLRRPAVLLCFQQMLKVGTLRPRHGKMHDHSWHDRRIGRFPFVLRQPALNDRPSIAFEDEGFVIVQVRMNPLIGKRSATEHGRENAAEAKDRAAFEASSRWAKYCLAQSHTVGGWRESVGFPRFPQLSIVPAANVKARRISGHFRYSGSGTNSVRGSDKSGEPPHGIVVK